MNIRQNRLQNKKIIRDKEGCYIMMKESTHQEYNNNTKCVLPNNRASKYIKQKLTVKEKRDKYIITVGDNNTCLLLIDSTSR